MKLIALELETIIDGCLPQLNALSEDELLYKPFPSKWSKKEIIGHLIDSAQNNIRQFIITQYEENAKIIYKQDKWVAINDYQHYPLPNLIELWYLLNKQMCCIWQNTPAEMAHRSCNTEALHTIEWLAQDYIKHLKHHLHQVLNLNPIAYP